MLSLLWSVRKRGTISYTYGGHIYRHLPKIKLKKRCVHLWNALVKPVLVCGNGGQKVMIHLKRNWPAKLLSLLAAIVMWFFIMRDQKPCDGGNLYSTCSSPNLDSHYIIEDVPDVARIVLSGWSRYDYVYKGR